MVPMARHAVAHVRCAPVLAAALCALLMPRPAAAQPTPAPDKTIVVTPVADDQDKPPDAPQVVLTPQAEADRDKADKAKSAELVKEARRMYSSGRYEQAIAKFEEAYRISKDAQILYSMAVSHQQLRDWETCVSVMEEFIAKTPPGPDPILDRARNTRDLCEARIESDQALSITTLPAGARVYVGNRNAGVKGQTPLTMTLRPGKHRVWIELDGYAPVMQDIEVQKREPFTLTVTLTERQDQGWLFVDATVKGAKVFVDGQQIGETPFGGPRQLDVGVHQVTVEREGYTRINASSLVEQGQLATVDAYMTQTDTDSGWRSNLGGAAVGLGALAVAGGVVAMVFANDEFNDTDEFETLAGWERLGYGVGGGLMAVGISLIVWDLSRDVIDPAHKNPAYGRPVQRPAAAPTTRLMVGPGGLGLGGSF